MRLGLLPSEWLMLLLLVPGQVESIEWVKDNVVKRSTKPVHIIDTLVVIDRVMFARWTAPSRPTASSSGSTATGTQLAEDDVRQYVSLVIRQANDRLSTLVGHLDYALELQVVEFRTNEAVIDNVTPNPLTGRRSGDDALEAFRVWVKTRNLGPRYDHIILLTGYDIEGVFQGVPSSFLKGTAYVATMCNTEGLSLSLVEDRGGFQSVFYVAHEVAHSLGSRHDGEDPSCSDADRYIMAGQDSTVTSSNRRNPWYFSSCSARAIDDYTAPQLSSSCFTVKGQPSAEFTATANLVAGQLYGANAQCQMIYGSESRLCLRGVSGELESICTEMFCVEPSSAAVPQCASYFAAEGTTCGNKKWCRRGQCITSEEAPELPESECQFGDSVQLVQGSFTCSQYVAQVPAACYDDDFRAACCSSCSNARTDSEVCPYGDRLTNCRSDECEFLLPSGVLYARQCCGTCSYNTERECNDVTSLDGVSCAVRAGQQSIQGCYNLTVAFHCCQTCARLRTGGEGCEYGDLDLLCLSDLGNDPRSQCAQTNVQSRCCRSCGDLQGNGNSGGSGLRGHTVAGDRVTWLLVLLGVVLSWWRSSR